MVIMATGKTELAGIIAEKTGSTKKQASQLVDTFLETVMQELAEGKKVQLVGFGKFMARRREARKGRSPATGEVINIPSSVAPVFKPGKGLKERLNNK